MPQDTVARKQTLFLLEPERAMVFAVTTGKYDLKCRVTVNVEYLVILEIMQVDTSGKSVHELSLVAASWGERVFVHLDRRHLFGCRLVVVFNSRSIVLPNGCGVNID